MRNLRSIGLVVHHQHVQVGDVVDQDLAEAVRHHVAGLGVAAVADARHGGLSAEAATHAVINTLGLSPGLLQQNGLASCSHHIMNLP